MSCAGGSSCEGRRVTQGRANGEARLRHIDALRAVAAMLVLWRHVADAYVNLGPGVSGRWLQSIAADFDFGRIGVVAFFMISGFVIPFSIHPQRPAPAGTFLIRRFFRIYPAYWLSVPLAALTSVWIWGGSFGLKAFLVNLTLLQDFFGVTPAEGVYWTLRVEWMFYLLCVGLLLLHSLGNARRLFVVAASLSALYVLEMLLLWWNGRHFFGIEWTLTFLNLSLMFAGALYRKLVADGEWRADPWLAAGFAGFLGGHLLVMPLVSAMAIGLRGNAIVVYALGIALFIVGTSIVRIRSRLTDWLGRVSYSFYLFHPIVFMALLWPLRRLPEASWWRAQHLGVYLIANALLTAALATLVFHWVERPGIEIGRRLARRWVARRAAPLDATGLAASATLPEGKL